MRLNFIKLGRELNERYDQIKSRLDTLYDRWLDGKVPNEVFEGKKAQYTQEKENVIRQIQQHSQASSKYFELGANIYDLSQRSTEIYQKANLDEKRQLIKLVFKNLNLDEGRLSYTYSKPFELLAHAVEPMNSSKMQVNEESLAEIFEPKELVGVKTKKGAFAPDHPAWLPGVGSNHQP